MYDGLCSLKITITQLGGQSYYNLRAITVRGTAAWVIHFEDKRAVLYIDLASVVGRTVVAEAPTVALQPATLIKRIKIVLPVVLKLASRLVVRLNLDVVIASVPWHARVVEVVSPSWESRSPEIHHEGAILGEEVDVFSVLRSAHHVAVNEPLNVIRSPLYNVVVPIGTGLEA